MDLKPKQYVYKTRLTWTSERKGILKSEGKPDVDVACAPEFGGHAGFWTPEDMFVGSVETCVMATFVWLANRRGVRIISYESEAEGTASMSAGTLAFARLTVRPSVIVGRGSDLKTIGQMFEEIGRWCLVSNSIVTDISIEPILEIEAD
jgi:organic hydroperoxide reductase OsmC/OhrA